MPHDLPTYDFAQSTKALLWLLLEQSASTHADQQQGGPANAAPPVSETLTALIDRTLETRDNVRNALLEHSLQNTQDYHLLVMVIGVLLSVTTHKSELLVRGVFGAGKTMCIALLASWFALRGHCVYYVSRENTTIKAMADFVHQLLPGGPDDKKPIALRLSSGCQEVGPAHSLTRETVMTTTPSSMRSSFWPPLDCILPSFGIGIGLLKRRLTMQSLSSMTKHNKRRP